MSLADMISRAMRDDDDAAEAATPTILPEAAIARLREFAAGYAVNPFKPGDLVIERPDGPLKSSGLPSVVVEVREADFDWTGDPCTMEYGRRCNVRVACFARRGSKLVTFWCEHTDLSPYSPS